MRIDNFKWLRYGALIVSALLPWQAQAHRTWLLPSATQVDSKDPWVTVDAAVAENLFEFDSTALKLDGLAITGPKGETVIPQNVFSGRLRSSFDVQLAQPGTYKISLVTTPVSVSYRLAGATRRWRGAEAELAAQLPKEAEDVQITHLHNRIETFTTTGEPNNLAFKPSGVGLELLPVTSPTNLYVDEPAVFQLLLDGKPAAELPLSIVPGGVRYRGVLNEKRLMTDAEGKVKIQWPAAGLYWLTAAYPTSAGGANGSAKTFLPRRVSYSATLEVLPH